MTQCEVILTAMLENRGKEEWIASDFQNGENFVGYEASARMSDLIRKYPRVFIVGKVHRFRTLKINWEAEETQELLERYNVGVQNG